MSGLQGGLPFNDNEGVRWKTLAEALRVMDFREKYPIRPNMAEEERIRIAEFREGIRSLELIDHEEFADFLRQHVESGNQIDIVSDLYYSTHPLTIFKTTKPVTVLPDCEGRVHLEVMIMRGHKLMKENPNDHCRVYDLNGEIPMPHLALFRDTASLMLDRGWKPQREHFAPTCLTREVDNLIKRGEKKTFNRNGHHPRNS